MLRKLLFFLLLASTPAFAATEVVFAWTNPNSPSVWPLCSSTVSKMCLVDVELEDITNSPAVVIATPAATAVGYTLTPLPSAGAHTYAVFYNAKDASGAATVSPQDTASITIPGAPPVAPASFAATVK